MKSNLSIFVDCGFRDTGSFLNIHMKHHNVAFFESYLLTLAFPNETL